MKNMKAYVRTNAATQNIELIDVPIPKIGADEVLVKIKAIGVGIHDRYFIPMNISFPYIIGSEGAGVIEELGSNVEDFSVGDRVIFTTVLHPQGGSWAEYAAVKKETMILLPENLSFAEGASLPIAGNTAIECIRELAPKEDDKIFIAGASGAIGTFVIQMASKAGARVAGSASTGNHAYMRSLGADKTVDYKDSDWVREVKEWADGGVDKALAIQPGTGIKSIEVVKDGGELITVSGDSMNVVPERNITVRQMGHGMDMRKKLSQLVNDISSGRIKQTIEKEYSFDNALEALQKTETRHARGKLVIVTND